MYIYIDEQGDLKVRLKYATKIVPLWQDDEHEILDAIIMVYKLENYTELGKEDVIKIEYCNFAYFNRTFKSPCSSIYTYHQFKPLFTASITVLFNLTRYKEMKIGDRYFANDTDIQKKLRKYIELDGTEKIAIHTTNSNLYLQPLLLFFLIFCAFSY